MQSIAKSLLNKAFHVDAYVASFPDVFCELNRDWQFSISSANHPDSAKSSFYPLAAFCAGRVLTWELTSKRIVKAFCLGSVCTDPALLGKGFASQVIESALEAVPKAELDACILFSDPRTLYQNKEFCLLGPDSFVDGRSLGAVASLFDRPRPAIFCNANSQDLFKASKSSAEIRLVIAELWSAEIRFSDECLSQLSFEQFLIFLDIPGQTLFWLSEANGKIVSLARYEKGCDFKKTLFGLFSMDFDWSIQLIKEVLVKKEIESLMVESYLKEWSEVTEIVKGSDVQLMIRTDDLLVRDLFKKRLCAVRGIQSC